MGKIAFLGAGNMATAIVQGLLAKQVCQAEELICHTASGKSATVLARATGIRLAKSPAELMRDADLLVIACKPQHLSGVDAQFAILTTGKLVVSVLSGKTVARLQSAFPHARNWIRTMPNTPGRIGAGITGWCAAQLLSNDDRKQVLDLLGALGREVEVPEMELDAITAVSGSGPAYVFEFAAALEAAAQNIGLTAAQARLLVVETLLGSARLLARTGESPDVLRDQVTSPNGTTLAGLKILRTSDFRTTMSQVVHAAQARAREISLES